MRETALSTCEKTFVEKAIIEKIRVDSRNLMEFRSFGLFFGRDFGSVVCSLGETRVFAQVSCELTTPKATRPNEGTIFINAEMGPMAAPNLEIGFPLTDSCIQINRILERTLRESRCVDLESLCIIAEEKVWNLRVDISVLNHEGNVMGEFKIEFSKKKNLTIFFFRLCLHSCCRRPGTFQATWRDNDWRW